MTEESAGGENGMQSAAEHGEDARFAEVSRTIDSLLAEAAKLYVGQEAAPSARRLVALFAGGHVLIESVPGLGKTLLVRILGETLGCSFGRIQFTADLMPSDITGQPVFDARTQDFRFRPGPVFTHILLADEINRAAGEDPRALLEIMQEGRVTVDGTTHRIEPPFLVLATQNPIESEGTYHLPEAQLDRFLFKIVVDYPQAAEEDAILRLHCRPDPLETQLATTIRPLLDPARVIAVQDLCRQVRVDDAIIRYSSAIVRKTRHWPAFSLGASPRARDRAW